MEEEAKRKQSGDVLKTKNFRYRRGQRGGRTFQRGGHNHFNNRSHTRKGPVGPNDRRAAENQSTEHSKNGNQARTSDDAKRMENGEDPLSLVLDGCDEEDENRR
ncbi:hypothetical protein OS493_018340 [Desmophyllum pertusum]|uniref:Uncharacterized protein n=1 Tax=Desmophyllum pertusum TaxID=174260 RepID=A0A9W9YC09_9CNID|nr:hypothetical protein OS493_018340 [Desmophyllum pertusum]